MDINRLKAQLKIDEGWRDKMYVDSVGVPTIGYGRNLWKGITKDEGEYLLEGDMAEAIVALKQNLPWFDELDDVRQEVLVNMCFNLGWPRLSLFKNTLSLIENKKYSEAASAMLQSLWATQVGARAQRLAYAMREGKFEKDPV